jgi:UDP:flavonoid glycosyltransferase YjiC (YdhE family)
MSKILLAWELGGDYGHLSRLIPVARELAARGHEPVFALRELISGESLLGPHGFKWHQAPVWLGRVTNIPDMQGYAEMLMHFGFLNPPALMGICRAWRNLVDVLAPDMIVLDHSPTGLLATRGLGLPRMNLGTGFFMPPKTRPMPPFRWWLKANRARLEDSEEKVRQVANEILFRLEAPPLAALRELTECDADLLCCFDETDHYPDRAGGEYVGPVFSLGRGGIPGWPQWEGKRVFAYLKPDYPGLEKVLEALRDSQCAVLAHVPGLARKTIQSYSTQQMAFSEVPVDIEAARTECNVAVGHAGIGTTTAMLLAGKPMLLLPMHTEQTMFAHRVRQMGAAEVLLPAGINTFARQLKKVLASEEAASAARKFAERHAGYNQHSTVMKIADRCESLVGLRRDHTSGAG